MSALLAEMLLLRSGTNFRSMLPWDLCRNLCSDGGHRYDRVHNIRGPFVEALKKEFPDYGLR